MKKQEYADARSMGEVGDIGGGCWCECKIEIIVGTIG